MNDADGGFSIESLGEDATEDARQQLVLLERALGSSPGGGDDSALFDEAYRAAHSLKAAVDPRRMPNVDRLARRLQDVVRAHRSGEISATSDLSSVLSSIVGIARDALDAVSSGIAEPQSASMAAAAMEDMLAHPGTWKAPISLSAPPFRWARIEASRLSSAAKAAEDARTAAGAFLHAAEASARISDQLHAVISRHEQAVTKLREMVPRSLAAAARGEPTAHVASELAETLSGLSMNASDVDRSLSNSAAATREAALAGKRAADQAETAFTSLRSVRLGALLNDLPRLARRAAKEESGGAQLILQSTDVELDVEKATEVISLIKRCIRAAIDVPPARKRKASGTKGHPAPRVVLSSRAADARLFVRFEFEGALPGAKALNTHLAPMQRRLERLGGRVEQEGRSGQISSIELSIPGVAIVTSRLAEFIFARSADAWYAIPTSSVVECVEAGMTTREFVLEGEQIPTMRMNDTEDPREGVVVKTPRGGALLLFDAVGDREVALQISGSGDRGSVLGIAGSVRRSDGTTARLVDLAVLLPEKR